MKKHIIASIVGGILIFFWQFLSNAALDLHRPAQQYTPKQDTVIQFLQQHLQQGRYFIPTTPVGASSEEQQKLNEQMTGKAWAIVDIHTAWNADMGMNITRGFLTTVVMVYLLCWILLQGGITKFSTILLASIFVGLIAFLNFPYAYFIWYKSPGIWADFNDAWIPWTLNGLWLGFYLGRK
jgi:hypothetical protein